MKIIRNILALILGIFIGSFINMALINLGPSIIPTPEGFDITTEEGLKNGMLLLEPQNFIFPFLAHALGTLSGAFIAAILAKTYRKTFALIIGVLFFAGGAYMVSILAAPLWFNILDLVVAYIPMAYLGYLLALKLRK